MSLGARQAVRSVGAALGLEAPRVNALVRLVSLVSSHASPPLPTKKAAG